ncbi:cytochrome c oxidase assembly protein [Jatrophihabitans sp.]|uniref:cytochrome c oxidase assembly protein n=1 Tax=Jatrophihabitans sp. TaxID=1932789 RepID=UPI0030C762C8|nr:Cytochrome c oxidase assembly factor CtaG [Jatrophihabitans sp.]
MSSGLPAPSVTGLVTHWAPQPVAIVAAVALVAWYWRGVRALPAGSWPVSRVVTFAVGVALALWTTCGFPQAYHDSLFWIYTSQQLGLLLIIPALILGGGPLRLAVIRGGPTGRVQRVLDSGPIQALSFPLIGPALVPIASVVLFFGPVPGWAVAVPAFGWVLQLLVIATGGLVVLRLIGLQSTPSSMAVGLALAIGSFELVLDAVPGIVLRLHRTLSTTYFDHRLVHVWAQSPVHDQQLAGSILWSVSELVDLPFLLLVFRQWIRADARDAAAVDAVLEAERIVRRPPEQPSDQPERDVPWWLDDPAMKNRLKRQG